MALGFSCAPRFLSSWLEEEREQMCQSAARGRHRCRLLRHPSLVRLIAPARHLPLPPAPPILSPSRGEEREGGGRRESPTPSYFATLRRSCGGRRLPSLSHPPLRRRSRSRSRSDHRAPRPACRPSLGSPPSLRTDAPFRPDSGKQAAAPGQPYPPLPAPPSPIRLSRRWGPSRRARCARRTSRPPGHRPRPPPRAGAARCAPGRPRREEELPGAPAEASASALLKARGSARFNRLPRAGDRCNWPSARPPCCPRSPRPSTAPLFPRSVSPPPREGPTVRTNTSRLPPPLQERGRPSPPARPRPRWALAL
ncbi:uncharacterized protein [Heliangelus exortis]|uniref:uncharacterized protein n=1 Tax=Heliangelus exortis TaxID=472823 RepID=UPI003A8E99C1